MSRYIQILTYICEKITSLLVVKPFSEADCLPALQTIPQISLNLSIKCCFHFCSSHQNIYCQLQSTQ